MSGARDALLAELWNVSDRLAAVEAAVRRAHAYGPDAALQTVEERLDRNGRPLLADMLAARGNVLAAIVNLTPEENL